MLRLHLLKVDTSILCLNVKSSQITYILSFNFLYFEQRESHFQGLNKNRDSPLLDFYFVLEKNDSHALVNILLFYSLLFLYIAVLFCEIF